MTAKRSQMSVRASDAKGHKAEASEAESPTSFCDSSAAKKVKTQSKKVKTQSKRSETPSEEAVREINILFSEYSRMFRERAAVDASQIDQLENILTEALSLESQLKEKKEDLKRSLVLISDNLER